MMNPNINYDTWKGGELSRIKWWPKVVFVEKEWMFMFWLYLS